MGVRLPAEYQEVEYIQGRVNANPSYIDTLYIPTINTKLRVKFMPNDINGIGYFGARKDPYRFYCATFSTGTQLSCGMTINSWPSVKLPIVYGNIYDALIANGQSNINGTAISTTSIDASQWSDSVGTIRLWSLNSTDSTYENATAKYYLCQIWEDNVLVRDFVPCYRKSDSEPGMYDLVSKTFYTNQGTGEFLVGPDVVNHISPRLMDRRRALIAKLTSLFRKVITSQTGLASFDTNVAKPMKVTCEFSPKQDLHGYDNPWPAGGGKNLIPDGTDTSNGYVSGYYVSADGTYGTNTNFYVSEYFHVDPSVTYTWSDRVPERTPGIAFYDENKEFISGFIENSIRVYTFNPPEGAAYARSSQTTKAYQEANPSGAAFQLEEGSTATAYAPYENICPIEGWDGANVGNQCGKNLFNKNDPNMITGCYFNRNRTTTSNVNYAISYVPINPGDTLIYSGLKGENGNPCGLQFFDANKAFLAMGNPEVQANNIAVTAPSGAAYIGISVFYLNNEAYKDIDTAQLEISSVATDYEPYHGQTLPIPFNNPGTYDFLPIQEGTGDPSPENIRPITPGLTITRDDNTTLEVWGGSLTVNADGTGSLIKNYSIKVFDGTETFTEWFNQTDGVAITTTIQDASHAQGTSGYCNRYNFRKVGTNLRATSNNTCAFGSNCGSHLFYIRDSRFSTLEEFSAGCAGLQVVYPIYSPVTYTLSVAETSRAFEALGLGKNLGPLYAGTVTINEDGSCDAIATMLKVDMGLLSWTRRQNPSSRLSDTFVFTASIAQESDPLFPKERFKGATSIFKWVESYNYMYDDCTSGYIYNKQVCVRYDAYIDAAEFKSAMSGVELVYELQTPQTYHFSSISELQSFLGTNNVWSDLNGPITVEYYKKQQ